MSATGENIIRAIEQLRRLYEQIGLLLETSDDLMQKTSWQLGRGSTCVGGSSSLRNPTEWLPSYVFREYCSKNKSLVSFVAVILCDPRGDADEPVTTPLLSAGCYDYGRNGRPKNLDYGWTFCHVYFQPRKDDGTFMTTTDREWLEADRWNVIRFSSMAVPLVGIGSAEDLDKKVIQPLLDYIKRNP
jgi:hypothetical protein